MGREYLSKEQIEVILPNYMQVFYTIREIRRLAQDEMSADTISKEDYEHIPYRNIICLLGERGSGKTSLFNVLRATLQGKNPRILSNENEIISESDIHLKLIVPEMLEENADILGVILLNIKTILDENKKIIDQFYNKNTQQYSSAHESCIFVDTNKIDHLWDEVFDTYLLRTERFNEVTKQRYSSLLDYSKARQQSLNSEIQLGEKIFTLCGSIY